MSSPCYSSELKRNPITSLLDEDRRQCLDGDLHALVAAITQTESDVNYEDERHSVENNLQATKKKRVYKKRKSTHRVRKEERQTLETEIHELESTLEALKLRVLLQRGEEDLVLRKQVAQNTVLRAAIQEHHVVTARAQTILARAQRHSIDVRPTEAYIHLPVDQTQRHMTLDALRGPKLEYAKQLIKQRSLGLHPSAEYFNEERYETPCGDFCSVRFDRTCLQGVVGGVRAVFEALKYSIFNAEIVLSEASGNITVREDDNMDDIDYFSQMRLVTSTLGLLVENNLVHFSEFVSGDNEDETYALISVDFVDEDDRFPYRPHEYIRRDTTSVVLLTSNADKNTKSADDRCGHTSSEEDSESVVVMTRWTFTRICNTTLHIPTQTLREMRDRSDQVIPTMVSIGAHYLRPSSSRAFPSTFQRQESTEDACEAYGADRHAAAALRGFSVRSKDEFDVKSEPLINYKKRKATHTIRKEEKHALELEIEKLKKQLEMLKFNTIVETGQDTQNDRKRMAKRAVLREAVHEQHLVFARTQAMLAGHSQQSRFRLNPTEMDIRLGRDKEERMKTLSALRGPKLQAARSFLLERMKGLNPTAPYFQEERYDTLEGDYCIARFDVTPFRGAKGVHEVFAALQQAVFNAEIIISESSGNITIREDDDLGDENLSHMRFVSQTSHGVQFETNLVLFSDCTQCQMGDTYFAENGSYAIMASDFVNEDDRYPYRPNQRIRRDTTTVTIVTSYRETSGGVKGEGELVVVVTRWALNIIRRPVISLPSEVWDDLRNSHVRWADLMFNCVRQALGLPGVQ
ncbi:Hypothetical protein PHPALM_7455 [Phytophthora palmivora]|uniref:Uncharacterized protein n=1 Tax=Phytophthora palmivora TaxID=4796 RepID=A0A2P4YC97_9STRA|nr:Hypothetical protein PHPALM_7455 [Phytophthora palmivora]